VIEELHEWMGPGAAAISRGRATVTEELGDWVPARNWSRHLQVDPELALRRANAKIGAALRAHGGCWRASGTGRRACPRRERRCGARPN
jgi:hypothetical protein